MTAKRNVRASEAEGWPPPGWPLVAWAGAGAGLLLALADFGASWLWMPWWNDRAWLLLRLIGLLVPMGALGAVAYGAIRTGLALGLSTLHGRTRGAERRWPAWLPDYLLALGPIGWVTHELFSGGMMSRLPGKPWLEIGAIAFVLGGLALALAAGRALLERLGASGNERASGRLAVGLLLASLALGKGDQLLYPKLYDYLHACLGVLTFAVAFHALRMLLEDRKPTLLTKAVLPGRTSMALTVSVALLATNLGTLSQHQNVQVSLLEPRAATARSVLLGFEPLLARARPSRATAQAMSQAFRERRQARERSAAATALPTWSDAHVVLVTIDALRADHLGLYGYDRATSPEIDAFAEEGVVFEHAYCAAPHSSYSLSSLMTSEYLHETVELGSPLPTDTLPSTLGQAGYRTSGFYTLGIFHTDGERLAAYRDGAYGLALHDHANMQADERTDRVLEEVDRIVAAGEPPSFLWVHYFDVHEPYEETRLGSSDLDRYDGEIQNADRGFGRLVREIESRFTHPVIFALTADHGEEFREHGGVYHGSSVYEEQARVPLIIRAPGVSPRRVSQPVELIDVAPTLLSMADLPPPSSMRGSDLRPLLAGEEFDPGPAFSAVSHLRMVVDWPYKLVANLRFGLYELYDLEHDPHERVNLASQDETRKDALAAEIYAWLDSLEPVEQDPRQHALELGRLGDRRAEPVLLALLADASAASDQRQEAARILANLADPETAPALLTAMEDGDAMVAAEAAIALGRQYDARAQEPLVPLVSAEDPDLRTRAAISLGRLRDPRAVPALLDALYVSHDTYDREEAVRWLGRLGDVRAVEPLIALLPEFRIRYLTVVALGMLGDLRAYDPLTEMLNWETHSNVRDNVARALGQLGDPRAIALLVPMAASEADAKYIPEALVRLGAIEAGAIGGTDAHRTPGARGLTECEEGPLRHDWDYLNRTHCQSRSSHVRLRLSVPRALQGAASQLLLRLRRADDDHAANVTLHLGGVQTTIPVDTQWVSHRLPLPATTLNGGSIYLELDGADDEVRLELDHALLVPASTTETTSATTDAAMRTDAATDAAPRTP